jgi:hypothetical protein
MQGTIQISTPTHNGLYDITKQVENIITESGIQTGMVNVNVQGATAGIMILFIFMYPLFAILGCDWDIAKLSLFNEKAISLIA